MYIVGERNMQYLFFICNIFVITFVTIEADQTFLELFKMSLMIRLYLNI